MKKQMLAIVATLVLMTGVARAQSMPIVGAGMTGLIQQQLRPQKQGNATARAAAMRYYQYALALRKKGYKGAIPTGVTTDSLNAANSALQQAGTNYIQGSRINAQKTWNSIDDTNAEITQGCSTTPNPGTNTRTRVCPY
jgi:hypothetical protein